MAQRLKALTALAEDAGPVPSTHMTAQNHLGDHTPLLTSSGTRHTYRQTTHIYKDRYIFHILFVIDKKNNYFIPYNFWHPVRKSCNNPHTLTLSPDKILEQQMRYGKTGKFSTRYILLGHCLQCPGEMKANPSP